MIFRSAHILTTRATKQLLHNRLTAAMSTTAIQTASSSANHSSAALLVAAATASLAIATTTTHNHCQVPCGIFDDPAMVSEVKQAATTIRKAMVQSDSLWANQGRNEKGIQSMNQIVRWITTKEEHCDKIIHIMADYCLCQRVKPESFASKDEYLQALEVHHKVMQAAMKAKQTMDVADVDALDHALADLAKMYT